MTATLAGGGADLSCVTADTTSPTVAIQQRGERPGDRPLPDLGRLSPNP